MISFPISSYRAFKNPLLVFSETDESRLHLYKLLLWDISPEHWRPEREADHSSASNTKLKLRGLSVVLSLTLTHVSHAMKTCTQVTNCVYITPPPRKKARGRELKQMENCRCLKPCLEKRATGEALQMSGVLVKADIDTSIQDARGSAFGWGTALQAGRSLVRFPMVSLEFTVSPSGRTMAQGLTQKLVPGKFPWGYKRPMRRDDSLTTFMCRLCWNMGVSTSGNPQGLSKPVQGFLFYDVDTHCVCTETHYY
jgi:hypothetical protein